MGGRFRQLPRLDTYCSGRWPASASPVNAPSSSLWSSSTAACFPFDARLDDASACPGWDWCDGDVDIPLTGGARWIWMHSLFTRSFWGDGDLIARSDVRTCGLPCVPSLASSAPSARFLYRARPHNHTTTQMTVNKSARRGSVHITLVGTMH